MPGRRGRPDADGLPESAGASGRLTESPCLPLCRRPTFRSIDSNDIQSKLYIFVRAEIIRPGDADRPGIGDIEAVSRRDREAFERHEQEFQDDHDWPGIKPKPVEPPKILEAR